MKNLFKKNYYLLIEGGSNTIVLSGTDLVGFRYLSDIIVDLKLISLPRQNFFQRLFVNKLSNSEYPFTFKWNDKLKKIEVNQDISEFKLKKYNLIRYKYIFFKKILDVIEDARVYKKIDIVLESEVKTITRLEAEVFSLKGYPEEKILEYPFVRQYAQIYGLSLKDAANMILELSKIEGQFLLNSEYLLLKYAQALSHAKSYEDVRNVYAEFEKEAGYKLN